MQLIKSRYKTGIILILSIFIPLFALTLSISSIAKAAVTLIYFKAIPDNGKVYFEWKTANEDNNSGFIITKLKPGGDHLNLGDYISITYYDQEVFFEAKPEGGVYTADFATCLYDGTPCEYDESDEYIKTRFFDDDVTNGETYWYKLVSIDNSENEIDGDTASAMPWDPSQPTWTPTGQTTSSPSATQTDEISDTKTPTSKPTKTKKPGTRTPTPTATRYTYTGPAAPSATQPANNNLSANDLAATAAAQTAQAGQPTATLEVAPTATLLPLPSITIVFPTAVVKQPDEPDANLLESAKASRSNSDTWLTPQRMVIVAVIAGIWIMLGGWFYLSFKRLEK